MGRKLATFFRQLKHLSFARMKLHINAVHEETGKNRLCIFCDMVWCEVRYGIGYLDYHVFGFANRRGAVRKSFSRQLAARAREDEELLGELLRVYGYYDGQVVRSIGGGHLPLVRILALVNLILATARIRRPVHRAARGGSGGQHLG